MEYVLEDSNAADYFNKHVVGFTFTDPDSGGNMDSTVWYSNTVSWFTCSLNFCFTGLVFRIFRLFVYHGEDVSK